MKCILPNIHKLITSVNNQEILIIFINLILFMLHILYIIPTAYENILGYSLIHILPLHYAALLALLTSVFSSLN